MWKFADLRKRSANIHSFAFVLYKDVDLPIHPFYPIEYSNTSIGSFFQIIFIETDRSMPWDSSIETRVTTAVQNAATSAQTSLSVITNQTNAERIETSSISNEEALINQAKANVESQIQIIRDNTKTVSDTIDSLYATTQTLQTDIAKKLSAETDKKQMLSDTETLNAIRMEQANALKQKYQGNYHSSWLGIWRPLKDESRTGLFVLSIVLGMIGILSIAYLLMEPVGNMLPTTIQETSAIVRSAINPLYKD